MPTPQPDITNPLMRAPDNQESLVPYDQLGYLKWLIGTWNSPRGSAATGFNVMPLPQVNAPGGFVLKNFPYYEEMTFAPIAGGASNRAGAFTQNNNVLFYEQRVYFADNPAPQPAAQLQDMLTHAENGSWLCRTVGPQLDGAYGPGTLPLPSPAPTQNLTTQYAKQVSVPHGNSLLMVGQAREAQGSPVFPSTPRTVQPFIDPAVMDPNAMLQKQLSGLQQQGITVEKYIQIEVDTLHGGGGINNVLFEQQHANVDCCQTTWYIEFLSNGSIQLQYFQFVWMKLQINGLLLPFLHSDANTLLPAGGQYAPMRAG